jgi:phospholipid transport system substrate-binding protein
MPTTDPLRRSLLAGLFGSFAGAALLAVAPPAAAAAGPQAAALVETLAAELTRLVNSGKSEKQIYAGFENILARYADMPAVGGSVLGPPWRAASAGQKQQFIAAFQSYLARKYGAQFREYQSAKIAVKGTKDGGKAGVLVQTTVVRPGQEDIAVDWQVSDRSGAPKVVNLVIEGVSMLANERAEIGAMLEASRGDLDGLIGELRGRS